jgi:hypothetical protein
LPDVLQSVVPFVSSEDVSAGAVWFETIGQELRRSDFAIICITPDNRSSQWLHFEAGAIGIAHTMAEEPTPRRVVPYLLELSAADLEPPLSLYQALTATEDDTRKLVAALNRQLPDPLTPDGLERAFHKWWPDLAVEIERARTLAAEGAPQAPERNEKEILEEILQLTRQVVRSEARERLLRSGEERATMERSRALRIRRAERQLRADGIPVTFVTDEDGALTVGVEYGYDLSDQKVRDVVAEFGRGKLRVERVVEGDPF